MINSGVYARYDAAAEASETRDSDNGVHALVDRVEDCEWSSAVTLKH